MSLTRLPTRQRIVHTAFELFSSQGITETTTRQIADQAEVNEVTLFRHFGNKHGLLLAVLQECLQKYLLMTQAGESIMGSELVNQGDLKRFLTYYAHNSLQAIESVPELVRSLVGEAGQYPKESRQIIAQGMSQVNQAIASALKDVMVNARVQNPLPPMKLASLVNTCILGYAVIAMTSEVQPLWHSREDFIATLVETLTQTSVTTTITVRDLSAEIVAAILQTAKHISTRDYALAYVLFGAGVTALELLRLKRTDYRLEGKSRVLQVGGEGKAMRLVPINQKICGQRYGSNSNNPLVAYLKGRKDTKPEMFLGQDGQPLTMSELEERWEAWTAAPNDHAVDQDGDDIPITLEQARHTWGVDMLTRGMDVDGFCIIGGVKAYEVYAYEQRAKEKAALYKALSLDS